MYIIIYSGEYVRDENKICITYMKGTDQTLKGAQIYEKISPQQKNNSISFTIPQTYTLRSQGDDPWNLVKVINILNFV